jgi:4-amino-4-deoxy-L-arabinose transferase-like glycosyltransferase
MGTIDAIEAAGTVGRRGGRTRGAAAATAPWVRPALFALLALTALAYLWSLDSSGYANSFYAAAVQAATKSWKAFFFGSLDSSSFITVDKPPASLWVMALSGRIFGFSSWSMLAPQALEGVAAVGLLYATMRRWFGPAAGLAAGAVLAITPVAALMFRFNNPDALLVTLLVAGAYCLTRALEQARTRWLVAAGALIGLAFLTKMGQALLVVPGFGIAYLVAAPTGLRRRVTGLLAGLGALIVSGGWWVAIVALLPAGARPLIDGSPNDSILNLILGYNGLSRLFGGGGPGGGGGGAGPNFSGPAGTLRLFDDLMGGQASWLLPAALIALGAGLVATRRAPRTDRTRAALLLWGGWLLVTAAVFSYSQGVIHTYYAVALAPPIAALVAIGGAECWRHRDRRLARALAAIVVACTAGWSFALLDRTPGFEPWLRPTILAAAAIAVASLLGGPALGRFGWRAGVAVLATAAIAVLAGPTAYTIETITTAHGGSLPSAGPTTVASVGSGGGFAATAGPAGGRPGIGRRARQDGAPGAGAAFLFGPGTPRARSAPAGAGAASGSSAGLEGAGPDAAGVSAALVAALERDAGSYRWVAATGGSTNAAAYELATGGDPVMAIGGFNGNGGDLALARFIRYVRAGEIHYYIAAGSGPGGGAGPGSTRGSGSSIESWVRLHYRARTIGGVTVYDLTA